MGETKSAARNLFDNLLNEGLTPSQIEEFLDVADPAEGDPDRNNIYITVRAIVRRSRSDEVE